MTRRTPDQYDWLKLEFDETILPAKPVRFTRPRREKIQFVVVHHMTIIGTGDGAACDKCLESWKKREASAHYGVDGSVVRQFVWDDAASYATANTHGNHAGISIEHANSSGAPDWLVAYETWKTGARLAAHLHYVYKLGRPVQDVTLLRHHDFFATACPGPYLDSIWDQYCLEAQKVYDGLVGGSAPVPAPDPQPEPEPEPEAPAGWFARLVQAVAEALRGMGWTPGPVKVKAMFCPLPGYNPAGAPGVVDWEKNTDGTIKLVRKYAPDLLATTEASNKKANPILPRLDAGLSPELIRVNGGSDGRHIWRNPVTTSWVAHKLVTTPKKLQFNGDDKQGFILVYEKDGARGIYAVFHAENQAGYDQGRVDQCLWFSDQVEAMRVAHGVKPENVLQVMDSNSETWVKDAFIKRGFKILGRSKFVGWLRKVTKWFDLAVSKGKGTAKSVSSEGYSDHDFMQIDFELVA